MDRPHFVNLDAAPGDVAIQWAAGKLAQAHAESGATEHGPRIVVGLTTSPKPGIWHGLDDVHLPEGDDSFVIACHKDAPELLVWGTTTRGVVYGLLELADRLAHGAAVTAKDFVTPMVRSPKARLRSVSRCFSSEIEDKGWFHDREGWRRYLDMLATNRFNRVALTFGMPYNYPYQNGYLTDVYLHFAYPFLVAPEGHDVRVRELSDDERADNLETLQFIGREAERRGLEFHLGLWTHGYDFDDTPRANYTIDGITPDNHAAYCRDALHALLVAVPQIRGVTLRVHIEGGVPEASYDFWTVVFQGIARTGRPIEVDLHAKGVEPKLIDTAIRSGLPVNISPKYLAEHMGLPYHQAAIRREESPPEGDVPSAMSFSEGSRRFLRYSYGDLLSRARDYSVSFRIWPGTQRILLWGDPDIAGGYGQLSTIAGATGVEICEPLSYKGRMGSGQPGGRFNYTDGALIPKYDWQKHEIFYRIWGRRLHDAAAEGPELLRLLDTRCGDAADDVAKALTGIGGVLNIVTQAYGPSACNHYYWPEIYDNLSLINPPGQLPYGDDFDQPGRFGNAPTFDPQLFANPAQYATEALADRQSHRYTPLDVAGWLDARAETGLAAAKAAEARNGADLPETRRILADVRILAGIARFFAAKFRAGCSWEIYLKTGDPELFRAAKRQYAAAIEHWKSAADTGTKIYQKNLSCGPFTWLQGNWADRVQAMVRDLNDIEAWHVDTRLPLSADADTLARVKALIAQGGRMQTAAAGHAPPSAFVPGAPVKLRLARRADWFAAPVLHYRRLNQAESWLQSEMTPDGADYMATIPGPYTDSDFELQYYFSVETPAGPCLVPGLTADLSNQPYFVLCAENTPKGDDR